MISAHDTASPGVEGALRCGNCGEPMRRLRLAGHYGQCVEIDLCAGCHLLWFDAIESARLTGSSLLALVGEMALAQREPHRLLGREARCPRCAGMLRSVHNRSRWGRSVQLECARRHGAHHSFAQWLAEKGLIRPLSSADRARLIERDGSLTCLNCGAPYRTVLSIAILDGSLRSRRSWPWAGGS